MTGSLGLDVVNGNRECGNEEESGNVYCSHLVVGYGITY